MGKTLLTNVVFGLVLTCALPNMGLAENSRAQFEAKISGKQTSTPTQLYTAYNLYTQHGNIKAINFQVGAFIPVGTPVQVRMVKELGPDNDESGSMRIELKTLSDQHRYTLDFTQRYHPGKTIYDYASLMVTDKTFEEQLAGKTPEVIDAIRRAAVIEGMTKEEVILSYGYPAEHRTPSLRGNTWTYWKNRRTQKKICFDVEEKATACNKQRSKDL